MKRARCSLVRAPLKRFSEALKRASEIVRGVSLERAHTPHTPRGRALERRPAGRWSARVHERSSETRPNGSYLPGWHGRGRGNSSRFRQSLLRLSGFRPGAATARTGPPWATRRRGVVRRPTRPASYALGPNVVALGPPGRRKFHAKRETRRSERCSTLNCGHWPRSSRTRRTHV